MDETQLTIWFDPADELNMSVSHKGEPEAGFALTETRSHRSGGTSIDVRKKHELHNVALAMLTRAKRAALASLIFPCLLLYEKSRREDEPWGSKVRH